MTILQHNGSDGSKGPAASFRFTLIELLGLPGIAFRLVPRSLKNEAGRNATRSIKFTLIELLVSMAVFSVLMGALIGFFNSAQKVFTNSIRRNEMYENAQIAMDLITRDLQSVYYQNEHTPFWHWAPSPTASTWGKYRNPLLAFVSATSIPPNDDCNSKLCEVKYQKYYATNHDDDLDGWLRRSVTGDMTSSGKNLKCNFYNNFKVGYGTANDNSTGTDLPTSAFTAEGNSDKYETSNSSSINSCMNFERVIPYVVELKFTCRDRAGNVINPDSTTSAADDSAVCTEFPYSIDISLTLMDKAAWKKWEALDNTPYHSTKLLTADTKGDDEEDKAWEFRKNHQRTFTKKIFIGDRGQYN